MLKNAKNVKRGPIAGQTKRGVKMRSMQIKIPLFVEIAVKFIFKFSRF